MAEDDKPLTKEEREQKWWDKWWEADYSWDGLAEKEWQGWAVHPDRKQFVVKPAEEAPADWRRATLQDYWRKAGVKKKHLIECGGRQFTKFHLPFKDRDGNATEKDGWDDDEWARFADELAPRLTEASETKGEFGRIDGADNRAQFNGVVARALPGPPQARDEAPQETEADKPASASPDRIHLSAENTWLSLDTSWSDSTFGPLTDFTGAFFSDYAIFTNATFSGYASFDNAMFSGNARFDNATFSGYASFDNATFSGNARFDNATFSGYASFDNATFSGYASFDNATFSGYARFYNATFSGDARFYNATFSGNARFDNATFSGDASFDNATFSGDARFYNATFSGNARFDNATFSGDASFDNATFSGYARFYNATFSGYARFDNATFSGDARFDNATFSGNARFDNATFSGNASFDNATFSGDARFYNATFSGNARFDNATFSGNARFDNATFSGYALFRSLNAARVKTLSFAGALIEKPIAISFARRPPRSTSAARAFLDVELPRLLNLSGDGVFTFFEMLDGAVTKGKVDFDEATFENDNGFKIALARAYVPQLGAAPFSAKLERFVATWHWRARVFFLQALSFESRRFVFKRMEKPTLNSPYLKRLNADLAYYKKVIRTRNKNLRALEGGCRTLKLAFENQRDRVNEQRFYRYELIARRHNMLTPWWERWTSHLFGAVSDYGGSITRPIGFLGGLWLTMAAVFFGLGLSVKCASPWGALTLSGEMIFRPFFVWAPRTTDPNTLAGKLLGDYGTGISFLTKFLGTVESLIAVILLFLVALAIRRRFQIN